MPLCACHHVHCFEREQGSTDHVITRLQLQALMPLWMQQQRSLMAQQCLGVAPWALQQAVRQRQGLAAAVAPQKTRSTPRVLEWGSLEAVLRALGVAAQPAGRPQFHFKPMQASSNFTHDLRQASLQTHSTEGHHSRVVPKGRWGCGATGWQALTSLKGPNMQAHRTGGCCSGGTPDGLWGQRLCKQASLRPQLAVTLPA